MLDNSKIFPLRSFCLYVMNPNFFCIIQPYQCCPAEHDLSTVLSSGFCAYPSR